MTSLPCLNSVILLSENWENLCKPHFGSRNSCLWICMTKLWKKVYTCFILCLDAVSADCAIINRFKNHQITNHVNREAFLLNTPLTQQHSLTHFLVISPLLNITVILSIIENKLLALYFYDLSLPPLFRYIEWLSDDTSARKEAQDKTMAPIVPELIEILHQQVRKRKKIKVERNAY